MSYSCPWDSTFQDASQTAIVALPRFISYRGEQTLIYNTK